MQSREKWQYWFESLHRLKMDGLVLWLMDAGSPLTLLGAQVLYISQPFVGGKQMEAIALMLEDEKEAQAFAQFMRNGGDQ